MNTARHTRVSLLSFAALLLLWWGLVFYHIRLEWTVNPAYGYGWAVPVLAAYLGWMAWQEAGPYQQHRTAWVSLLSVFLGLLFYFPLRVVQEANPDWVKTNWLTLALVATVSLSCAWTIGGFRLVRGLAFPFAFCFTALPWPVWLDTVLVQSLSECNAGLVAEVLTCAGIPALATGNVIQVSTEYVNVEDACSGLRSLQTSLMMSLFLGAFYRLALWQRLAYVGLSLGFAFGVNLVRTLLLTFLARQKTLEIWHDNIGTFSMGVTLLGVFFLLRLFKVPESGEMQSKKSHPLVFAPFAWPLSLLGLGLLLAGQLGAEYWYRSRENTMPPPLKWTLVWPEKESGFRYLEFSERSLALLKYNHGKSGVWLAEPRYRWRMYQLDWEPGRVSKHLAKSHYPTVCLPAAGMEKVAETGPWVLQVGNLALPFLTYVFQQEGRDIFVFHAIIEDRASKETGTPFYHQVDQDERLSSVWKAERNLGQHVLGIALEGPLSPVEARGVVARFLRAQLRVEGNHL